MMEEERKRSSIAGVSWSVKLLAMQESKQDAQERFDEVSKMW